MSLAKEDRFAEVRTLVRELMRSKGIELPSIPDSAGRQAYLRFLGDTGYSEKEILPVIRRSHVSPEMRAVLLPALLQAAPSEDRNFVKAVCWMALNTLGTTDSAADLDNTNIIIFGLSEKLTEDLKKVGVSSPPFYPGIYPTDSFNAQARIENGQSLVLIDTGFVETLEAGIVALLSRNSTLRAQQLGSAIEDYVFRRVRPDSHAFDTTGIDFGKGQLPLLLNTAEEFLICHEMGPITLGHVREKQVRHMHPNRSEGPLVADKNNSEEFHADSWALMALSKRAFMDEGRIVAALGGVAIGLWTGFLVEQARKKHQIVANDTHPSCFERIYLSDCLTEALELTEQAYVGRRFRELCEECCLLCYPDTQFPPMLSRNLNQKILPILRDLDLPPARYRFVEEFI